MHLKQNNQSGTAVPFKGVHRSSIVIKITNLDRISLTIATQTQ